MIKQELIHNGYIYVTTTQNNVEVWGKLIIDEFHNELLHYYYYSPLIQQTLGEPQIISGQMLSIAKSLIDVFHIAV